MLTTQILANLCTEVINCNACSGCGKSAILRDETFNVPQPGFVGSAYTEKRVMFIGQNPGVSPERSRTDDTRLAELLLELAKDPGTEPYAELRAFLADFMDKWAITQRYLPLRSFGLSLDEIAYLNVVRCRTRQNIAIPKAMTARCAQLHLERWLDTLQPKVVVFLGKWAHDAAGHLVSERGISYGYINRDRSLSGAARAKNMAEIAFLLGAEVTTSAPIPGLPARISNTTQPATAAPPPTDGGTLRMDVETYTRMLRSLGFLQVERGKVLTHASLVPSIYLNKLRDGFVYFTAYARDAELYADSDIWTHLSPQQLTDNKPKFITIVPVTGQERRAFQRLIEQSK